MPALIGGAAGFERLADFALGYLREPVFGSENHVGRCCPTISFSAHPSMRSAPLFQLTTSPVHIERDDGEVHGAFHQQAQALIHFRQGFFAAAALRDVEESTHHRDDGAVRSCAPEPSSPKRRG